MAREQTKYEEWLTTIANTRLLYNTLEELEQMLDNRSIHSNGIKRCFNSPQKLRAAFRDLKVEVDLMTDSAIGLDHLLLCYQEAWIFYREHLYRRSNPEQLVVDLLAYCYPPFLREGLSPQRKKIFEALIAQEIKLPLIILMLLKVLPGYDSEEGDVTNMPEQYERVMSILNQFTNTLGIFKVLPIITKARQESNKTRLNLIYYVSRILNTYESFADGSSCYTLASDYKNHLVSLNINGFWNECGGKLHDTRFWQIEEASNRGSYFATRWYKDANNRLSGIRYLLFLSEDEDMLSCYMQHPQVISRRINGQPYEDKDHTWYQTEMPAKDNPTTLSFQRLFPSETWPITLPLTRCTDPAVTDQYERWLTRDCEIVREFQHLEYRFDINLHAVTTSHIYIPTGQENEYYKIPRTASKGLDHIQIGDNVGILQMDGQTYLAFDEILLYIHVSKKELHKYGITVVRTEI